MVQKKIRVLVITHAFPTKYNPTAATFIINQLQDLKKYCDIKVIVPFAYVPKTKLLNPYHRFSNMGGKGKIKGIEVNYPKFFMIPRIFIMSKILNFLLVLEGFFARHSTKKVVDSIMKKWNPDIVHLHGPFGDGLIGIRIKEKYHKPLVLTVHGEDVTKYLKKIFSRSLMKHTLRKTDAIVCQSKFLENGIRESGIRDNKFHIIPMGAKKGRFMLRNKDRVRQKLKLPSNKKIILFTGHLDPRKGVTYLLKAMNQVLKKREDVMCYLIGTGKLEKECKEIIQNFKIGSKVKLLGAKSNEEVALYMSACDMFVLPSLMEGLPVVLCEALLSGKPVVATAVAGTPELVTKDVGYLVKPKNEEDLREKIILALNKKWNQKKILTRGAEFSTSSSVKKLVKLYNNLLKK